MKEVKIQGEATAAENVWKHGKICIHQADFEIRADFQKRTVIWGSFRLWLSMAYVIC